MHLFSQELEASLEPACPPGDPATAYVSTSTFSHLGTGVTASMAPMKKTVRTAALSGVGRSAGTTSRMIPIAKPAQSLWRVSGRGSILPSERLFVVGGELRSCRWRQRAMALLDLHPSDFKTRNVFHQEP